MKHIIHIFGASGSGTSTLGRKISEELGFRFMDTDDYFWMPTNPPYTTKRPPDERLAMIRADIEESENVVLSGALSKWGDPLIPYFTLAIRLHTDTALRIERLKRREHAKFGSRIDEGGDMHRAHLDFLAWAASYDTGDLNMRSCAEHNAWQKLLCCPLLELDGGADLQENFLRVREALSQQF